MRKSSDVLVRALVLLDEIKAALARGTKHYNASGTLLTTPKAIVETLLREGGVLIEPL